MEEYYDGNINKHLQVVQTVNGTEKQNFFTFFDYQDDQIRNDVSTVNLYDDDLFTQYRDKFIDKKFFSILFKFIEDFYD